MLPSMRKRMTSMNDYGILNRNNSTCEMYCALRAAGEGIYTDCSRTLVRYSS